MKRASLRHVVTAGFVAAMAAAAGCAYGPLDGSPVNAGDKVDWLGFATAPKTTIDIQARWTDGNWYTYDTAISDSVDYNTDLPRPVFDRALYQWYKDGSAIPSWAFNSANQASVRAVQLAGTTQYPMWMFDSPGYNCLSQKFFAAYYGGTLMDTEGDDQTCSRATNGGQDRNFVTVHR